jgi:hypothetical protein
MKSYDAFRKYKNLPGAILASDSAGVRAGAVNQIAAAIAVDIGEAQFSVDGQTDAR